MSKKSLRCMIMAFIVGRFNHASQYMPLYSETDYQYIQSTINGLIGDRLGYGMLKRLEDESIPATEREILLRYKQNREEHGPRTNIVDQWYLLGQLDLMSLNNIHRLNSMLRLGKLMITGQKIKLINASVKK